MTAPPPACEVAPGDIVRHVIRTRGRVVDMKKLLLILPLVLVGYLLLQKTNAGTGGSGVMVSSLPVQTSAMGSGAFDFKDYRIQPLASFDITARVLSRKNYRTGRESDLSPVDLALGWGPMSDDRVLDRISIRQSNRWYFWQVREFPIPRRDIERNSANMHIIPATPEVRTILKAVKKGDIVRFHGKLIRAEGRNNWRWTSSLTREDTGDNACELVWVEQLQILDEPQDI